LECIEGDSRMKSLKKFLGYLVSPFALGVVVTLIVSYFSLDFYASRHLASKNNRSIPSFIQQFHEKTLDWRLTDRGQIPGSDRVAILAIDDRSLEQEGRWPWPRDKMAKLTEKVLGYGAKGIAFDIVFSEEDSNSSLPTLQKIRRDIRGRGKMVAELDRMLESEIARSDVDRTLAETIQRNADQLILGAFFEEYDFRTSYKDFCLDALHERSYERRYWKKESIPLTVIDQPLIKVGFPSEVTSHLETYFTILEISGANGWIERNREIIPKISYALDELANVLPMESYGGLSVIWLNNDIESGLTIMEQISPAHANPAGVRAFFSRFGSAFTKKETAALMGAIRTEGREYCDRFFAEEDELLNPDLFTKRWGSGEDASASFGDHSWQSLWTTLKPADPDKSPEPLEDAIKRIKAQSMANSVPQILRWTLNIPILADSTKHTGYFNAVQDTDGSIRRSIVMVRRGNSYMPSLALKTFLVDNGYTAVAKIDVDDSRPGSNEKGIESLEIHNSDGETVMVIPVDREGHLKINYAGGRHMFPYVNAADLLSDDEKVSITVQEFSESTGTWRSVEKKVDKRDFLQNKLLIAGATATAVFDLRVTPFEENYPGVETHANVLSNLLVENARKTGQIVDGKSPGFLRVHPDEESLMWIVLLVLGLLMSGLLSYFGSVAGLALTVAAIATIYLIDKYVFFRSGIVTTIIFPHFLVSANFVTLTFYKYFTEERKKRELKGTFEKYVSPSIVAEVLADPENIELGGKKVDLTVMFSDVRGFTTISEKLDPRELSNLLNRYLTPMTDLVFKNKGTLDKYMGDAIMAFWGAPIHFNDHAKHACRCALQMIDKLKELQAEFRAKGLPEIDIGIGLNSGDMSVGNMGSDTVRSYTVMGDAVNLGSRLEGINKEYGTRIIISEFTNEAVKDTFVTREVDWVRVKGKTQPVRIFELVGENKVSDEKKKLIEFFNQGFLLYHDCKFQEAIELFSKALALEPDDAVTQLYLERCQDYLKEPPPENWDGVFTMTTK
jgi:adenylate cyclase